MLFGGPDVRKVIGEIQKNEDRYHVAMKLLNEYFIPRVSKTFEKQKFRQMIPAPNEKIDTFIVRLKKQAGNCDFGDQLENMLVDQVVMTTKDTKLKRMCLEKDLNLEEVLSIG